jgi:protein-tyrosine phosphatase
MSRVFFDLQVAGLIPILTHPERNPVFHGKPEVLAEWVGRGCLVQVTAKSFTGGFGQRARRLSEMWLDQNLIHFFASDAHDTKYRPPLLSVCYEKLAAARGETEAERIMKRNPEAVIQGKPLPAGPQPARSEARKRGFFAFLRGH